MIILRLHRLGVGSMAQFGIWVMHSIEMLLRMGARLSTEGNIEPPAQPFLQIYSLYILVSMSCSSRAEPKPGGQPSLQFKASSGIFYSSPTRINYYAIVLFTLIDFHGLHTQISCACDFCEATTTGPAAKPPQGRHSACSRPAKQQHLVLSLRFMVFNLGIRSKV